MLHTRFNWLLRYWMALLATTVLMTGCGGGGGGGSPLDSGPVTVQPPPPTPPSPTPPSPTPPPFTGGLSGSDDAPALQAVSDIPAERPEPGNLHESGVFLNLLGVMFERSANVGQVNAALAAVDGRIASAFAGSLVMIIEVPRQSNPQAILGLAEELEALSGVIAAWSQRRFEPTVLPRGPGGAAAPSELDHLLPTRFPAAWNARALLAGCENRVVEVLVPDNFSETAPPEFFNLFPAASMVADPEPRTTASNHGYVITLAMGANHDGTIPTGAHPAAQCLRVIQLDASTLPGDSFIEVTARLVANPANKLIVQTSLGDTISFCGPDGTRACDPTFPGLTQRRLQDGLNRRAAESLLWARRGLTSEVVRDVLFVVAAGNERNKPIGEAYKGFADARFSLYPQAAALLPIADAMYGNQSFGELLWNPREPGLPPAHLSERMLSSLMEEFAALDKDDLVDGQNVITVGATANQPANTVPASGSPLRQTSFSNFEADVHTVGEDLRLGLPNQLTGIDVYAGTSVAAPQVSGLAAYLWLLSDELRAAPVAATRQLLRDTVQQFTVGNQPGNLGGSRENAQGVADIIDAYAAVLALDRPGGPKRVRLAILDITGDGRFTEADIEAYLNAFAETEERGQLAPDFSRFDLNGDGFTGGSRGGAMDLDAENYDLVEGDRCAGFDLNRCGPPVLQELDVSIDGVPRRFDERFVTDLDALCFYAYDQNLSLYSGDPERRSELLGIERCAPPTRLSIIFPEIFEGDADLDVLVTFAAEGPDGATEQRPLPDLRVRFSPNCSSVSNQEVRTNSAGRANVRVTPDPDCTAVSVRVDVLDSGGALLASEIVTANVLREGPSVTFQSSDGRASTPSGSCPSSGFGSTCDSCSATTPAFLNDARSMSDSQSCASTVQNGGSGGGDGNFSLDAFEVGGNLTAITLTATGNASASAGPPGNDPFSCRVVGGGQGSAEAEVFFRVESPITVTVTGNTGAGGTNALASIQLRRSFARIFMSCSSTQLLSDGTPLSCIHSGVEDFGPFPATVVLEPGNYSFYVSAGTSVSAFDNESCGPGGASGSASVNATITFSQ